MSSCKYYKVTRTRLTMPMAIGGPVSFDIIQMRYAKKSWPTPPTFIISFH